MLIQPAGAVQVAFIPQETRVYPQAHLRVMPSLTREEAAAPVVITARGNPVLLLQQAAVMPFSTVGEVAQVAIILQEKAVFQIKRI